MFLWLLQSPTVSGTNDHPRHHCAEKEKETSTESKRCWNSLRFVPSDSNSSPLPTRLSYHMLGGGGRGYGNSGRREQSRSWIMKISEPLIHHHMTKSNHQNSCHPTRRRWGCLVMTSEEAAASVTSREDGTVSRGGGLICLARASENNLNSEEKKRSYFGWKVSKKV